MSLLKSRKRILVCPLNWGLGHATRCIPVIRELIANDIDVIIGADNGPLSLLSGEFPQLECIRFPGYIISYPKNVSMPLKMLLSLPRILRGIYREHLLLKSIIKSHKIDAVISDNRYGLWNNTTPTVFITHQVMVKCPEHLKFLEPILHRINKFFIDKYDECWIPDIEGKENLSADLSHRYPLPRNANFIGSLSRFNTNHLQSNNRTIEQLNNRTIEHSNNRAIEYDMMAIISGPEPQRSIFEKIVLKQLERSSLKAIIVRGAPEKAGSSQSAVGPAHKTYVREQSRQIDIYSHLVTGKMREAILSSNLVLSRPGYSTIMDLAVLGKKAILVPTPGQTEQEYLAGIFHKRGVFCRVSQEDFSSEGGLYNAIEKSAGFSGIEFVVDDLLLKEKVKSFIETY